MTAILGLGSSWIIRPFEHGDAASARHLIEKVWQEHFQDHPDPLIRDFIYSRLSDVDSAVTRYRERARFLCAVADGSVIGTGAVKPVGDRGCEMVRMFVASAYRGRGIGHAIACELLGFARSTGFDQVRLSSNKALAASHRLYERLGFQPAPCWEPGGEAHSRYYELRIASSHR